VTCFCPLFTTPQIKAYASRTGTKTTVAAMRKHGWRMFITPLQQYASLPPLPYAIDNGAWSCHLQNHTFAKIEDRFTQLVDRWGQNADFIIVPDIVAGGLESLAFSLEWLPKIKTPLRLLAVQDGMKHHHIERHLKKNIGIFVGGSTEWKLKTIGYWGNLAKRTKAYIHVGRVNTAQRITACLDADIDSFDGTSVTKFPSTIHLLDSARRQQQTSIWNVIS